MSHSFVATLLSIPLLSLAGPLLVDGTAAQAPSYGPVFRHAPLEYMSSRQFPRVELEVGGAIATQSVRLCFRAQQQRDFYFVEMTREKDSNRYVALLPMPLIETATVVYYFEVVDAGGRHFISAQFHAKVTATLASAGSSSAAHPSLEVRPLDPASPAQPTGFRPDGMVRPPAGGAQAGTTPAGTTPAGTTPAATTPAATTPAGPTTPPPSTPPPAPTTPSPSHPRPGPTPPRAVAPPAVASGGGHGGAVAAGVLLGLGAVGGGVYALTRQGEEPPPAPYKPRADLAVAVSTTLRGSGTVNVPFPFLIQVSNLGPDPATNVALVGTIPSSLVIQSITASGAACTSSGTTVTCTVPSLSAGASFSVTVNVRPTLAQASLVNSYTVTAAEMDPDSSNNSNTMAVAVQPATVPPGSSPKADLAVTMSTTLKGSATVDVPFSFVILVSNNGPDSATNVTLTDAVPGSLLIQNVTASGAACATSALSVRCTVPSLLVGRSFSVDINVRPTVAQSSLINSCTVTASETDPDAGNNSTSRTVAVQQALVDVAVDQSSQYIGGRSVPPYYRITSRLTVAVQNRSSTESSAPIDLDVAIRNTSVPDWDLVSIQPGLHMTSCFTTRALPLSLFGCRVLALAPGQEARVSFDIDAACCGTYTSHARAPALGCEASVDPDCSNNSDQLTVTVITFRDAARAPEPGSQPGLAALASSLNTVLLASSAEASRGTIALNGLYLGAVDSSIPLAFPFSGRPGRNRIEARLVSPPRQTLVWQFSFEDTPGFVPGSLVVESGAPTALGDHVIAFRLGQTNDTVVRFRFSLAE